MTGEVVFVSGNWLLCKMQPLGNYTLFDVQPGREFIIDGQTRHIGDLKPGTVLTGTIVTSTTPVTMRTTSTLEGTVLWAQNNYVVLRLDSGEVKEYKVPGIVPIQRQGQACDGQGTSRRDESLGHQDCGGAAHRDLERDPDYGEGTQIGHALPCLLKIDD